MSKEQGKEGTGLRRPETPEADSGEGRGPEQGRRGQRVERREPEPQQPGAGVRGER